MLLPPPRVVVLFGRLGVDLELEEGAAEAEEVEEGAEGRTEYKKNACARIVKPLGSTSPKSKAK